MSSASRVSESGVKPTRSAKRTETRRRSAAGASRQVRTAATVSLGSTGAPHSPQNFSPPASEAPHDGHATASAVPHSDAERFPASFSAVQLGQIMRLLLAAPTLPVLFEPRRGLSP